MTLKDLCKLYWVCKLSRKRCARLLDQRHDVQDVTQLLKLQASCIRQHRMLSSHALSSVQGKTDSLENESSASSSHGSHDQPILNLNRVAVVGKMTRFEFERQRYLGYSEEQFKQVLCLRGSNYETLLTQHKKHKEIMKNILDVLKKRGIEYRICTRGQSTYSKDSVEWADAVITAGGDGTFLSAASKITNINKPLIGINTDPERSEGHLCLSAKYSTNFEEALSKIAARKFKWLYRQRIRVTVTGSEANFRPIENGSILQKRMREHLKNSPSNYNENSSNHIPHLTDHQSHPEQDDFINKYKTCSNVLPVLALNEVFFGESLSSIPSYYELQIDGNVMEKQKSSGVCISTGTGSTAWSYNICRLHSSSIRNVMKIALNMIGDENTTENFSRSLMEREFIDKVTSIYGDSFLFNPSDAKMLYSIRDPMQNKVYRCRTPHSYAKEIFIRSRCWDAALCIDGDTSFMFNDGATATLQVLPEDSLKTIVLEEA